MIEEKIVPGMLIQADAVLEENCIPIMMYIVSINDDTFDGIYYQGILMTEIKKKFKFADDLPVIMRQTYQIETLEGWQKSGKLISTHDQKWLLDELAS